MKQIYNEFSLSELIWKLIGNKNKKECIQIYSILYKRLHMIYNFDKEKSVSFIKKELNNLETRRRKHDDFLFDPELFFQEGMNLLFTNINQLDSSTTLSITEIYLIDQMLQYIKRELRNRIKREPLTVESANYLFCIIQYMDYIKIWLKEQETNYLEVESKIIDKNHVYNEINILLHKKYLMIEDIQSLLQFPPKEIYYHLSWIFQIAGAQDQTFIKKMKYNEIKVLRKTINKIME